MGCGALGEGRGSGAPGAAPGRAPLGSSGSAPGSIVGAIPAAVAARRELGWRRGRASPVLIPPGNLIPRGSVPVSGAVSLPLPGHGSWRCLGIPHPKLYSQDQA